MFRTKLSIVDILSVAVVLLCAVLLLWQPWKADEKGDAVIITSELGRSEYTLTEDRTISLTSNGVTLTVEISGGAVTVLESDCPDGVCKASGRISRAGETIVCAPAGVSISVKGAKNDVDFVAG